MKVGRRNVGCRAPNAVDNSEDVEERNVIAICGDNAMNFNGSIYRVLRPLEH